MADFRHDARGGRRGRYSSGDLTVTSRPPASDLVGRFEQVYKVVRSAVHAVDQDRATVDESVRRFPLSSSVIEAPKSTIPDRRIG